MKFCKDCKHARVGFLDWLLGGFSYEFAKCTAYAKCGGDINLATGRTVKPTFWFCSSNRLSAHDKCGSAGKLWEARQ